MATKEELNSVIDGLYATINGLAQQLSSVVHASDFETEYRGRIHEIRRVQEFFAGIRRSKYEKVKAVHIAMKTQTEHCDNRTIIECLGLPNKGTPTVGVNVKNCIYADQQLFGVGGGTRPVGWQNIMHTVMILQNQEEQVSGQLRDNGRVWGQIQADEYNEQWMHYDFIRDPKLLGDLGSLLTQLKSLT